MTDLTQDAPIAVETNPIVPIATAVARQAITAAGAALVARGVISQGVSDQLAPEALGLLMVGASTAWGWWKARHTTAKFAAINARTDVTVAKSAG